MFRKLVTSLCIFGLMFGLISTAFALDKQGAIDAYVNELPAEFDDKTGKAESEANAMIEIMESSQAEVVDTMAGLDKRVKDYNINDPKKDDANKQLKVAKDAVDDFEGYDAKNHLDIIGGGLGVLPQMVPDNSFQEAEKSALDEMNKTNRILLDPRKLGNVPEGDLIEDFLPQLIRQLFRFAWVAVLVALVISGIMFITAFDNDERITKAKHMIYYTLIGFTAVTLAFAIVKAITDIDFFRFI